MLSHFSHVQLFVTLWSIAHQSLLSIIFSRQEYWSRLSCPPPGDLPDTGIEPRLSYLLHWQVRSLPQRHPKNVKLFRREIFFFKIYFRCIFVGIIITKTRWFINNRNVCLTVLETGSLKSWCQHGWVMTSGLRLLTFHYIFRWQESELAFWFLLKGH